MLPLVFANPADYDAVRETDRVSVTGLAGLAPGKPVRVDASTTRTGASSAFETRHTLSAEQIAWFRAGSALNVLRQKS